jgi:UPF0176 protein
MAYELPPSASVADGLRATAIEISLTTMPKHKILLYYKYTSISDPDALKTQQKDLCQNLNLKGRILISEEGINGTIAGIPENIDKYILETESLPELGKIEWKISWADKQVFPKLKVKVRPEIVTLGLKQKGKDVDLNEKADYIEPEELRDLYDSGKKFIIIDARNQYEAEIGTFADAVVPPIKNFRDFPEFVKKLQDHKDTEIVTYCTGGVRCEKASAYMRSQGFKKVRQLHGGIHRYGELVGGKHFQGEMFVFDERLHVPVNQVNPKTISQCEHCQEPVARYIDCTTEGCPSLFICCESCEQKTSGVCKNC